ncbi:MAG: glycosyltransferase family 4 protein [Actinomycetota bacterium]
MRIGIAISVYRRTGGLERVAGEWARGLRDRGHDVIVFAQTVVEPDPGIRFVKTGGARKPGWLRAATFPFAAARAMQTGMLDVACSFGAAVNAKTVMGTAGPHRAWFDQGIAEAPLLSIEGLRRRLNPHHRVVMMMERHIVGGKKYERVLATSRMSANDFARLYSVPDGQLGVLENGVNFEEFRIDESLRLRARQGWRAGDRAVVLSLSNEISRKGIDTLIRSFPRVLESRADALLVIGGPISKEATRLCRAAGLPSDAVRIIGPVLEPSVAFNGADLFAFPTRYDPWGLVAIESLACGTPVVCGASAGVVPHLRSGETAIVLEDVRSEESLARAIIQGLSIKTPRESLRESVEHLAWPHIIDRVEAILKDVVSSHGAKVRA